MPAPPSPSLSTRRNAVRRAVLRAAKDRFREMQSEHANRRRDDRDGDGGGFGVDGDDDGGCFFDATLAAPISPTPDAIVESFLPHLLPHPPPPSPGEGTPIGCSSDVVPSPLFVDVGCGDGRWLLAAARLRPFCACVGVDIDDDRLARAKAAIDRCGSGVADRIRLEKRDAFDFVRTDAAIDGADAIVLYLFRDAMAAMGELLKRRLLSSSKRGGRKRAVRILSVGFKLPGWKPILDGKEDGIRVYLYEYQVHKEVHMGPAIPK